MVVETNRMLSVFVNKKNAAYYLNNNNEKFKKTLLVLSILTETG